MINLENKNIILTGSTGGIGSSIVETLTSLKARQGRNPKNSETVQIPAKKAIKWKR